MKICPICSSTIEKKNQEYCLTCAWEFEYFFDELSETEKKKYHHRIERYRLIYNRSTNTEYVKELENQIIELRKEQVIEVKDKRSIQEERKEIAPISIKHQKFLDRTENISSKEKTKIGGEIVTIDNLMYHIKISKLFEKKSWIEAMEESSNIDVIRHNDWRLPTKKELKNLLSQEKVTSKFFSNFNNKSSFWTSEERSSKHAWEIQLKNNRSNWGMKTNKNYVIYLRDIKEKES